MALQKHIELNTGIVLPEAYIRITEGILSLDRGLVYVTVETYADKIARDNKKVPVIKKELKSDMTGSKPQIDAVYRIQLNNSQPESGQKLVIDVDGNQTMDFELMEGTHITTDGTIGTLVNAITEKLNLHETFSLDFVAEVTDVYNGYITIKAKADGDKKGASGNTLTISGDMLLQKEQLTVGQNQVKSSFEQYFLFDLMNEEGKNLILLAYEFIKGLPEYQGSIDV